MSVFNSHFQWWPNSSASGHATAPSTFWATATACRPDVVCLDHALNDRGPGLAAVRTAWVSMIEKAQAAGAKVMLLTPTPDPQITFADETDSQHQHAAQVRQLAQEFQTGLVEQQAWVGTVVVAVLDGIHSST